MLEQTRNFYAATTATEILYSHYIASIFVLCIKIMLMKLLFPRLVDIEFLFCRSLQVKPLSQANYTCKVVKQKKNCGNHTQAHFLLLLSFKLIKKRIALLRLTCVEYTFPEYVNFLSHFIAIKSVHPQNR